MSTTLTREQLEAEFHHRQHAMVARWREFLTIPSISAEPSYQQECERCAAWLRTMLQNLGGEVRTELLPTSTKPVVYAEFKGPPGAPVVLYYGHYDVQPPDPLEEWQSKPFEPELRGDRLYARGALDNKGQSMYFFEALRVLIEQRRLGCTVRVVMEGEEESGSAGLYEIVESIAPKLRADVLMVCDTDSNDPQIAEITMGVRGIVHLTAKLLGPKFDLHSGIQGGVAPNPATQMARLIAAIHAPDGSIAIPGFYDDIQEYSADERKVVNRASLDAKAYEDEIGVPPCGGEAASYTPQERRAARPTVEINGIHSGYGGPGHKTIIPAVAEAKITSRLVRGQNPHRALKLITDFLTQHTPQGLRLEISEAAVGGEALALNPESPLVARAEQVLLRASGVRPVLSWCGGSLPIVARLAAVAKAEPLMVGFGCAADRMHAPNESFSLSQFRRGFVYAAMMLEELATR